MRHFKSLSNGNLLIEMTPAEWVSAEKPPPSAPDDTLTAFYIRQKCIVGKLSVRTRNVTLRGIDSSLMSSLTWAECDRADIVTLPGFLAALNTDLPLSLISIRNLGPHALSELRTAFSAELEELNSQC